MANEVFPTSMPKSVEVALEELEEDFNRLDEMWKVYREESARVIKRWEGMRVGLLDKVAKISGVLSKIERELEELYAKIELGMLSSDKAAERINKLEETRAKLEGGLNTLKGTIEKFENWSRKHRKLARVVAIGGEEDILKMLETLEKLKQAGSISEDVYERIRKELQELVGSFVSVETIEP